MKVLYYSAHPGLALQSLSGYGTHMREMIKAFEQDGHEVFPVIMGGLQNPVVSESHSTSGRPLKNLVKRVIPGIVWESIKDYRLLRMDRRFETILEKNVQRIRPDLIYERANYLQLSGVRVAARYGISHVLEVNSPYVAERKVRLAANTLFEKKAHAVEKEQLLQTRKVAVVSQALKDYFIRKHDLAPATIMCTPNAIDPNKVSVDEKRVREIKNLYKLHDRFVIGFVGSIIKWHRVDLLIQACQQLRPAYPNLRLLIVGDSRIVPELKQLSEQLGVADRVLFVGRVAHEEVFNFIGAMDGAVLPDNQWYQSPVKLFEYGAMGKPVVAPDNATVRDLIRHGEQGLLVKPNAEDLASSIRLLINEPERCERMARAFQRKVITEYTWARNVERVLQAITENEQDGAPV